MHPIIVNTDFSLIERRVMNHFIHDELCIEVLKPTRIEIVNPSWLGDAVAAALNWRHYGILTPDRTLAKMKAFGEIYGVSGGRLNHAAK